MNNTENVNIDDSPSLIPLQTGLNPQLASPIVVRTVGTISSIAGLLGPDILLATGGATNGLSIGISAVGSTVTFSISGATTAVRESSGPTTLTIGAVADGQFLTRSGVTLIGKSPLILLASPTLNLNTNTKQTLYTVTTGKSAIIALVVPRSSSGDLSTGATTSVNFGFNAGATDWSQVNPFSNGSLTSSTQFLMLDQVLAAGGGPSIIGTSGQIFGAITDVAFGSAATVVVDVWGYEF